MTKTTKIVAVVGIAVVAYYFLWMKKKPTTLVAAAATGTPTTTSFTGYSQAKESKFAKSFVGTAKSFK